MEQGRGRPLDRREDRRPRRAQDLHRRRPHRRGRFPRPHRSHHHPRRRVAAHRRPLPARRSGRRLRVRRMARRSTSKGGTDMNPEEPFVFSTEWRLVALTGRKARNLDEMLKHLREVTGSSIFYHTHHEYLAHHFERPSFHNDFSIWVSHALLEERLAEKLTSIDLLAFPSIRQLREAIIQMIEEFTRESHGRLRDCPPGQEFYFCESQSFVTPTGVVAATVPEFFEALRLISNVSIYFHFFEARLRLDRPTNDFSQWLRSHGEEELAAAIDRINPYEMTLDELKCHIIKIGQKTYA